MNKRFLNLLLITGIALGSTGYTSNAKAGIVDSYNNLSKEQRSAFSAIAAVVSIGLGSKANQSKNTALRQTPLGDLAKVTALASTWATFANLQGIEPNRNHITKPLTIWAATLISQNKNWAPLLNGMPGLESLFDKSELSAEDGGDKKDTGLFGRSTRLILTYILAKQAGLYAGIILPEEGGLI